MEVLSTQQMWVTEDQNDVSVNSFQPFCMKKGVFVFFLFFTRLIIIVVVLSRYYKTVLLISDFS